jgi:hypothetical protein
MGCEGSRAFATCLRACGLIRERKRKIFGSPGPKLGSRSRLPVTNPGNFLEERLEIVSLLPTAGDLAI